MLHNLPNFSNARIIIVGDVMLDSYLYGNTTRISPEAPVPVVNISSTEERAGGAANVAINVSALGAHVKLLGFVGEDNEALRLENILKSANVDAELIRVTDYATINKTRVVGRHQQLLRLDFEKSLVSTLPAVKKYSDDLRSRFSSLIKQFDLVIFSDYGKGVLSDIQELITIARANNKPILVDPKSKDFSIYRGTTIVTPNLDEFEAVVGKCPNEADIVNKANMLCEKFNLDAILVTRGEKGMSFIASGSEPLHIPTKAREVYDVTGAGDTVIATIGAAIAAGSDFAASVILSNIAASIVVQKFGAATVTTAELRRALQRHLHAPSAGIFTEDDLMHEISAARAKGEKIVMTNGCFDILHFGHASYLEKAKSLGDRLIVAVNDDNSVKRLKGNNRPINSIENRMLMLSALRAVDWVVSFSEDTPERIITIVKPDVLAKGGDYKVNEIAGAGFVLQNGGRVEIIPFVDGFSTTNIIRKFTPNS